MSGLLDTAENCATVCQDFFFARMSKSQVFMCGTNMRYHRCNLKIKYEFCWLGHNITVEHISLSTFYFIQYQILLNTLYYDLTVEPTTKVTAKLKY